MSYQALLQNLFKGKSATRSFMSEYRTWKERNM